LQFSSDPFIFGLALFHHPFSMEDVKRPWQGTALGIMDIIGVVMSFLLAIAAFALQGFFPFLALLGNFMIIFALMLIGFGILAIFMARGAFKGQKWSPILSIVFGVLGLLSVLNSLFTSPTTLAASNTGSVIMMNIVITLFMLYCASICLKDPFYNQK
jgi:hypothetical protein